MPAVYFPYASRLPDIRASLFRLPSMVMAAVDQRSDGAAVVLTKREAAELLGVGHTRLETMLRDELLTSLVVDDVLHAREQRWITVGEAGAILGVNRSRVGQLVTAGRLPCFQARTASRRWFRRTQVEVIANAREARMLRPWLAGKPR